MDIEKVKQLKVKIEEIQSILIAIGTRRANIQDKENSYKQIYKEVELLIEILNEEGLSISNPITFFSLWDWYKHYNDNSLNTYASREKYVYDVYLNLINELNYHIYLYLYPSIIDKNIETLDISAIQLLSNNLKNIKDIMIDTATYNADKENESIHESYYSIYSEIERQIIRLNSVGIPIENPNHLRTIPYWKVYYKLELEGWSSRREFVNTLYANIVDAISNSLGRQSIKNSSKEDFFQDLKNSLSTQDEVSDSNSARNIKSLQDTSLYFSNEDVSNVSDKISIQNETDVIILTALPKERDAILKYLESHQMIKSSGRIFHKASIITNKSETVYQAIVLCLPSMGNNQAVIATQRAITEFNPSHIILAGIAGGVPKENSRYLGDIIVGEQIVDYALNKQVQAEQGNSQIQPRYQAYRPARVLLEAAKNLPLKNWAFCIKAQRPDGTTNRVNPAVHFGVVASGNTVIADQNLRDELTSDWSQLVGVEMEGAGAALAAYENDFMAGVFLVKGMCDWADGSKNDDWQEYAAQAAAAFVIELLKSAPFESKFKLNPQNNCVSNQEALPESNLKSHNSINENPGKTTSRVTKNYSWEVKTTICQRLGQDWENLADYFEIKLHERATFDKGNEPRRTWEWLQRRDRLNELKKALIAIERKDLAEELNKQ